MIQLEPHYAGVDALAHAPLPRNSVHIVLDNLRSAYNVGSIFRTADAAAVEHIHLTGMSAHPPHVKLEKTALGALDYVPWTYHERTRDALERLAADGIPRVAIEVTDRAVPLHAFDWPRPVAIMFGNEVTGIHPRNLARCEAVVKIPMAGYKNSMNVATAAGVVLYHILHRWNALA